MVPWSPRQHLWTELESRGSQEPFPPSWLANEYWLKEFVLVAGLLKKKKKMPPKSMLIPKRATVSLRTRSRTQAVKSRAWCCSAVLGPPWWGRDPTQQWDSCNASPYPWISHWTMVHASHLSPPLHATIWGVGLHLTIFKCKSQTFSAGSYDFPP